MMSARYCKNRKGDIKICVESIWVINFWLHVKLSLAETNLRRDMPRLQTCR